MVTLTICGEEVKYKKGTTYEEIARDYEKLYDGTIALVMVDGKITELMKKAEKDCTLKFITLKDPSGHKAYVRTATMLLLKALYDVEKRENIEKVKVEFAIGQGYYIRLSGKVKVDRTLIERVNVRMEQLVQQDIPIEKTTYPLEEGMELFDRMGMTGKKKLFKYRRSSFVNIYKLDDFYDYYYGYMLPSTGYIKYFKVISYEKGLMLLLPDRHDPKKIDYFVPREKLFHALERTSYWGEMMGIDTVGDLNNEICKGGIAEVILVQEALQERRIAEIAEDIVNRKGVKFVMIAGPSSSGKTTFSHRLSVQLRSYGMKPHPIGVDDYFLDRELTPRDKDGKYNFECLEAIDVAGFNEDMSNLLAGKTVELPSFNFKTGKREYKGNFKTLGEEDILVIEGIHCLNDKMSLSLPTESKYKIYISALTSLNIDEHNRIPTTDGRLLRRMVRDARTRGISAKNTIAMWQSVRRGEEENIFPFQESADATFNSVLIYELAVLKNYAEPLLFSIRKDEPEYHEAKRLLKFLEYFLGIDSEMLPNNSIVREFIGGSVFNV